MYHYVNIRSTIQGKLQGQYHPNNISKKGWSWKHEKYFCGTKHKSLNRSMRRNVIYCHSSFPPRFPDLRWPHCTPYRLFKKFFPYFLRFLFRPFKHMKWCFHDRNWCVPFSYCLLSPASDREYLIIFSYHECLGMNLSVK